MIIYSVICHLSKLSETHRKKHPDTRTPRTTAVSGIGWRFSHYVNWRAYINTFQKELSTYTDILECVLQLWTEHSLSGANNPRSEMPDWLHVTGDHLDVLLPAALPAHRQLDWRSFHKNVSRAASLCWETVWGDHGRWTCASR